LKIGKPFCQAKPLPARTAFGVLLFLALNSPNSTPANQIKASLRQKQIPVLHSITPFGSLTRS